MVHIYGGSILEAKRVCYESKVMTVSGITVFPVSQMVISDNDNFIRRVSFAEINLV